MDPTPLKPLTFLYVLIGLVTFLSGLYVALTVGTYLLRGLAYAQPGDMAKTLVGAAVAVAGVLVIRAALREQPE